MLVHNINPILIQISGNFAIRYYGLAYAIGFLAIYFILKHNAKNNKIKNLTPDLVDNFTIWLIVAVILGGRLGEVLFYNLPYYINNPLHIFMLWKGGMAFHGAIIGIGIMFYFFCKKHKLNFLEIADVIIIPTAFILFIGRIANFVNAELIGTVMKSKPWYCIDYSNYGIEGCRHPSQIYESLKNLFIGFSLIIEKNFLIKTKNNIHGILFFTFIWLYGLLRFLVTFYRVHPTDYITFFGLGTGQIFSLAMFIIGIVGLIIIKRKNKNKY
jgi:phosphatidylglycerol:prolipoprotein diacylglycerol transferase